MHDHIYYRAVFALQTHFSRRRAGLRDYFIYFAGGLIFLFRRIKIASFFPDDFFTGIS